MTSEEKLQSTLQYLLDNNVGSFIYPDGLKKHWGSVDIPENEWLSIVTELHHERFIEVHPRDSIDKGHFPKQLKISFKGIKDTDEGKLVDGAEKTVDVLKKEVMEWQIKALKQTRPNIFLAASLSAVIGFGGVILGNLLTNSNQEEMTKEIQKAVEGIKLLPSDTIPVSVTAIHGISADSFLAK